MKLKAMGLDQDQRQDLKAHNSHKKNSLQVVVGASAQRGGSTGLLNSEGEGYHLRACSPLSTLLRAQVIVRLESLNWSLLKRCENYEKLKLTGDNYQLETWVEGEDK